jgi:hypothetical protein
MKRTAPSIRLISLGRVSRETRSIGGPGPEASNPVLIFSPL